MHAQTRGVLGEGHSSCGDESGVLNAVGEVERPQCDLLVRRHTASITDIRRKSQNTRMCDEEKYSGTVYNGPYAAT